MIVFDSAATVAQAAYDEALKTFKKELGNSGDTLWLDGQTTMAGILSVVGQARSKAFPENARWSKISEGLDKISSRVIFYGGVLDALSQHHPEYVSLAWGALKFVLMVKSNIFGAYWENFADARKGIINHGELLHKFVQAFVEIGDALNSATCIALLYDTTEIEATTSQLYLQMMRFLGKAVEWYAKHPIRRMLSAIAGPWELKYEDSLEGIRSCATRVKDHAIRASWAELRVVHDSVNIQEVKLDSVGSAVSQLQGRFDEMLKLLQHQLQVNISSFRQSMLRRFLLTAALDHRDISVTLRKDMDEVTPGIRDLRAKSIVDGLRPDLDAKQNLLQMQLVLKRNNNLRDHLQNGDHLRRCVEQWFNEPASSLLISRVAVRFKAVAKAPLLDLILALQSSAWPTYFVLPKATSRTSIDHSILLATWIKAIIYQVMNRDPDLLLGSPQRLQAVQYCTDHSPREWMHLLGQLLTSMPKSCLVLDTYDLYEQYHDEPEVFQDLINLLRDLMESVRSYQGYMKVFILYYGLDIPPKPSQRSQLQELACSLQYRPIPPTSRARHSFKSTIQRTRLRRVIDVDHREASQRPNVWKLLFGFWSSGKIVDCPLFICLPSCVTNIVLKLIGDLDCGL